MSIVKLKVLGTVQVTRFLNSKKKRISSNIEKDLKDAALLVVREIKESIAGRKAEPKSVDTGQFLSSIGFRISKDNAFVFSHVPHSSFLEFGTSRIHERRHFRNSLSRERKNILDIFQKRLV